MKGITNESINAKANSLFPNDPDALMNLYKLIYDGDEISFDLTEGKASFKMNKNLTVSTLEKFVRRIKCV